MFVFSLLTSLFFNNSIQHSSLTSEKIQQKNTDYLYKIQWFDIRSILIDEKYMPNNFLGYVKSFKISVMFVIMQIPRSIFSNIQNHDTSFTIFCIQLLTYLLWWHFSQNDKNTKCQCCALSLNSRYHNEIQLSIITKYLLHFIIFLKNILSTYVPNL